MYTKELKNEIENKLLRNDKTSTNPWIYRKSYIKDKNLDNLISKLKNSTNFLVKNSRLDERIYCILNDIYFVPKCDCGEKVKFKRYGLGYANFCSVKCRANNKQWQTNVANTNLKKYGVTHIAKLDSEREKRRYQLSENISRLIESGYDFSISSKKRKETIRRIYGEHYNSGWSKQAIETRINNGNMVPVELLDEYREYYREVQLETKKQPLDKLKNIEKRGVIGKDKDAHHIDHIVSIYDGFMNEVPSKLIGNINNLQCIPGRDNITKGNDSWMTIEELYEVIKNET